jgi:hypothetical protein
MSSKEVFIENGFNPLEGIQEQVLRGHVYNHFAIMDPDGVFGGLHETKEGAEKVKGFLRNVVLVSVAGKELSEENRAWDISMRTKAEKQIAAPIVELEIGTQYCCIYDSRIYIHGVNDGFHICG